MAEPPARGRRLPLVNSPERFIRPDSRKLPSDRTASGCASLRRLVATAGALLGHAPVGHAGVVVDLGLLMPRDMAVVADDVGHVVRSVGRRDEERRSDLLE